MQLMLLPPLPCSSGIATPAQIISRNSMYLQAHEPLCVGLSILFFHRLTWWCVEKTLGLEQAGACMCVFPFVTGVTLGMRQCRLPFGQQQAFKLLSTRLFQSSGSPTASISLDMRRAVATASVEEWYLSCLKIGG
jgi:hypothetical protein